MLTKRPDYSDQKRAQAPEPPQKLSLAKRKQTVAQNTFDALEELVEQPKDDPESPELSRDGKLGGNWRVQKTGRAGGWSKGAAWGTGKLRQDGEGTSSQKKAPTEEPTETAKHDGDGSLKMESVQESRESEEKLAKHDESDSSTTVPVEESEKPTENDKGDTSTQESEGEPAKHDEEQLAKLDEGDNSTQAPVLESEKPAKNDQGNKPNQEPEKQPTKHDEGGNPTEAVPDLDTTQQRGENDNSARASVQDMVPTEQCSKGENAEKTAPAIAPVNQTSKTNRRTHSKRAARKKNKAEKKKAAVEDLAHLTTPVSPCPSSVTLDCESPVIFTPEETPPDTVIITMTDQLPHVPEDIPLLPPLPESSPSSPTRSSLSLLPPLPESSPSSPTRSSLPLLPPLPESSPSSPTRSSPPLPPRKKRKQPAKQPAQPAKQPTQPATPPAPPPQPPPPECRVRLSKSNLNTIAGRGSLMRDVVRIGPHARLAPPPPPPPSPPPAPKAQGKGRKGRGGGGDGDGDSGVVVWRWTAPRHLRFEQLERVLAGDGVVAEARIDFAGYASVGEDGGVVLEGRGDGDGNGGVGVGGDMESSGSSGSAEEEETTDGEGDTDGDDDGGGQDGGGNQDRDGGQDGGGGQDRDGSRNDDQGVGGEKKKGGANGGEDAKGGKKEATRKGEEASETQTVSVSFLARVRGQTEALVERFAPAGMGLTREEWRGRVREAWFTMLEMEDGGSKGLLG